LSKLLAQLLVPVYVPAIAEAVTPFAEPVMVALQFGDPEIDPAGIVTVNVSDVPDSVPDTLPLKEVIPVLLIAVTVPDTELPDDVIVHVILPAPVESDAFPVNVPFKTMAAGAGDEGAAGDDGVAVELELPPHDARTTARNSVHSAGPARRTVLAFDTKP
jgi:hypothetical protein